ncbi:MAG: protein-S-isoprenylcysteine methyltransferase [Moraxellaceae bacterium]|nr:MAG: protein-S-isoprenylcysteine methyltransferase [Moraxellaceae bacterium]
MEPSHFIFLIVITIYLFIRGTYMLRSSSNKKTFKNSNIRENILVSLVAVSQLVLPLIFIFTPLLNWANYKLPIATTWLGLPVMVYALYLFWRSHADLGDSWSVKLELNLEHKLVDRGVYHLIRHPMYSSLFLLGIGQSLLLNNWLAGWAALASFALLYRLRLPHEEAMMLDLFGEEYRSYMERTGRIIPRLSRTKSA